MENEVEIPPKVKVSERLFDKCICYVKQRNSAVCVQLLLGLRSAPRLIIFLFILPKNFLFITIGNTIPQFNCRVRKPSHTQT